MTTDGRRLPVNRIFCIAKNYENHAEEMGGEVDRERPFHFQKSFDTLASGLGVCYPTNTSELHHEVGLVARRNFGFDEASIFGYAVGFDFTRRDRQAKVKGKGRPWETGKNFDDAAAMGVVSPKQGTGLMKSVAITLYVNDVWRQTGNLNQVAYKLSELFIFLSTLQELKPGYLVFTETPSGVSAVS